MKERFNRLKNMPVKWWIREVLKWMSLILVIGIYFKLFLLVNPIFTMLLVLVGLATLSIGTALLLYALINMIK